MAINITICSGVGGLTEGAITRRHGMYVVNALAIEVNEQVARTHKPNHPEVPVLCMKVQNTKQTLAAIAAVVPKRFWYKVWVHASNSCKQASTANFALRDLHTTVEDTSWMISLMQRMKPAVWTLENVPVLYQFFRKKYPTCRVFEMHKHCRLAQSRRRLIISSHDVHLKPTEQPPMTVRDLLGEELGWKSGCKYWTRNSFHSVRDCDHPMYCITSGNMFIGAERVGDFEH